MTPQPLVICWSAIVEYLLTSPCAFWMSAWKPAASRPSCRYLWSKFSQRGDDAASGRITHARVEAASPPPLSLGVPPPPPEQPASSTAAAPARATAGMTADFFIFRLSSLKVRSPGSFLAHFALDAILPSSDLGVKL